MATRSDPRPGEPRLARADGVPGPPPPTAPPPHLDPRSVGDLFRELAAETSTLLRQEVALARTEIKEEVKTAGRNVGYIAAGGAVAYAGLIVLLIGLGRALGRLLGEEIIWLGIVITGAVVVAAGYAFVRKGLDRLQAMDPVPERTVESLKEDKQWLQNETRELTS